MDAERGRILAFPDYLEPANRLSRAASLELAEVDVHRFPDGESLVRVPADLPSRVVLCRSLDDPNAKLIELLLAADAARQNGATQLTLVAPYLCYMRQDKAFVPGQAVSQRTIGSLLAEHFDAVVTVDPHLHRVHELSEAVPAARAVALTAAAPMAAFLGSSVERPVLVGPDEESRQWVEAIALPGGLDYLIARKRRFGDTQVEVVLPEGSIRGRHVVLVDDVASTGRTLEAAATGLRAMKPLSIRVMVTHALFVGDALARLRSVGIDEIVSTDSIPHPTNRIELAGLLADAL